MNVENNSGGGFAVLRRCLCFQEREKVEGIAERGGEGERRLKECQKEETKKEKKIQNNNHFNRQLLVDLNDV